MAKSEEFEKLLENIKEKVRSAFESRGVEDTLRTFIKNDIRSITIRNEAMFQVLAEMAEKARTTDAKAFYNIIKSEMILIEYGNELLSIYNEACEVSEFEARNNPVVKLARNQVRENVFDRADKLYNTMGPTNEISKILGMLNEGKNATQIMTELGIIHKKPANHDNVIQFQKPEEK
jgi:hypothetical protein